MRYLHLLAGIVLALATATPALAVQPIPADSMGLSKSSVFEVPTPQVYRYKGQFPGQDDVLPRAYQGAPPQIPHDIGGFLPITAQGNMCIGCHDQPAQWGKKRGKGTPTPIPQSHYTDMRNAPGKVSQHLVKARFNCNQCHVPQADAAPLVENTFSAKTKH